MEPKITIAISTYNRADYLQKALHSVQEQTSAPYEILIQNDGGTDNTAEVVRNSGLPVQMVRWENHGLAACRNQLISRATGDWILFLDDDDLLFPHALESFQRAVQDPAPRIIYGRYQRIDSEGKILPTSDKYDLLPQGMAAEKLFRKNFLLPSCTLLPVKTLRESGLLFPEGQSAEDYDLFLKLALQIPVQGIDDRLVYRRRHKSNISSLGGASFIRDQIRTLETFLKIAGEEISPDTVRARMAEMFARYAKALKKDGESAENVRNAWKTSLTYRFSVKRFLQMLFS